MRSLFVADVSDTGRQIGNVLQGLGNCRRGVLAGFLDLAIEGPETFLVSVDAVAGSHSAAEDQAVADTMLFERKLVADLLEEALLLGRGRGRGRRIDGLIGVVDLLAHGITSKIVGYTSS